MSALTPGDWDATVAVLRGTARVSVIGHKNPDADALGSVCALGLALASRGVEVAASFSDPFVIPDQVRFLPGLSLLVPAAQVPTAPEVLVVVDTASPERMGTLADRLDRAGHVIVIDHHASNTRFGDINIVDPAAAAAAVLVAELIDRLPAPLDRDIATCLYAGVVADTGSFRFDSVTPAVHRLAARLLEAGVRPDPVAQALFDAHPRGWLSLVGTALASARIDGDLVWTAVRRRDLADAGVAEEESASVIGLLRRTVGADVAAVFKELEPDVWDVSVRSRGGTDVGAICVGFGGGGHRLAAGYTARGALDVVAEQLRAALGAIEMAHPR